MLALILVIVVAEMICIILLIRYLKSLQRTSASLFEHIIRTTSKAVLINGDHKIKEAVQLTVWNGDADIANTLFGDKWKWRYGINYYESGKPCDIIIDEKLIMHEGDDISFYLHIKD